MVRISPSNAARIEYPDREQESLILAAPDFWMRMVLPHSES